MPGHVHDLPTHADFTTPALTRWLASALVSWFYCICCPGCCGPIRLLDACALGCLGCQGCAWKGCPRVQSKQWWPHSNPAAPDPTLTHSLTRLGRRLLARPGYQARLHCVWDRTGTKIYACHCEHVDSGKFESSSLGPARRQAEQLQRKQLWLDGVAGVTARIQRRCPPFRPNSHELGITLSHMG